MNTNKEIRPLCISFWTPPLIRPQAILMQKMIPEWCRQGVEPVIVTYDICGQWDIDIPIYHIPPYAGPPRRFAWNPFAGSWYEFKYYREMCERLIPIIHRHNINVIYSFANPTSSNLLGVALKQKTGAPLVAHFSDPWFDNPLKERSWLSSFKIRLLEWYVIKHSDLVTTVDEAMKEHIKKKYPFEWQKKIRVVNHCYDPKLYPTKTLSSDGRPYIISHIGAFYKKRMPHALFRSLVMLRNHRPDIAERLCIRLIGGNADYTRVTSDTLDKLVRSYNLQRMVELLPTVEYQESLCLMTNSDALLVIDPEFRYYIASKVIDYAGSRRPIIAITQHDSSTALFVKQLGYQTFTHTQTEELAGYLTDLIEGKISFEPRTEFLSQYSVTSTTSRLFELFKEAMQGHATLS
ncbi:glycosyltransferase [Candidatus Uhrbacteria bacterium]|nr:glycosyltransferase [Candidatus Uhrbacteria bacterium]